MRGILSLFAFYYTANVAGVYGGSIQLAGLQLPPDAAAQQAAVKSIFLDSYNAYKWVIVVFVRDCCRHPY